MSPTFTRADVESAARAKAARAGVPPRKVRSALPTPKEREIQKAILAYLKLVPGVVAWRNNVGAQLWDKKDGGHYMVRYGFPGLSDIGGWRSELVPSASGCECHARMRATPLYIEVKRPGTYPTAEQQAFLDSVQAAGGIALVARSVEDVRRVLQPTPPAGGGRGR